MASARILLFKHKRLKNNSYPIVLQLIKDRRRKIISLGKSASEDQWDEKDNLPTKKHPNYKSLILLIQKKLFDANNVINELEKDELEKPFTLDDIVNKLRTDSHTRSVFTYTEAFIMKLVKTGNIGNSTVYNSTLAAFKKFRKEKDLTFNQLSYKVVKEFEESLLERKIKLNTISLYLRTLRAIYNHAIKDKVAQKALYPFTDIHIKSEVTPKRAISKEDITKIRNLKLVEGSELDKARDYFLFSFDMRGMSFVDMAFLKNRDIVDGRLQYSRKKTGQKFSIKVTEEAERIMRKHSYSDDPECFVFQIIQRKGREYLDYRNALRLTNKKLRLIGQAADCSIRISTYVSRHSWATIAKRAGVPTAIISEGLGHESEKTTQIYLDSFENKVLDDANELIVNS
jgi:site-specific recombinase XerD